MNWRPGILLAALCASAGAAAATPPPAKPAEPKAGWPCTEPPPGLPNASSLWPGATWRADWRNDPAVSDLVAAVAQRAVPEAQATERITAFAATQADRRKAMALLASGLIDTIGAELQLVIRGIERFNIRQAQLAERIEAGYGKTGAASADTAPQDNATKDLREQIRWDTQIFEDRQRLLPTMCRIPGTLTQRLGVLLATVRTAANN